MVPVPLAKDRNMCYQCLSVSYIAPHLIFLQEISVFPEVRELKPMTSLHVQSWCHKALTVFLFRVERLSIKISHLLQLLVASHLLRIHSRLKCCKTSNRTWEMFLIHKQKKKKLQHCVIGRKWINQANAPFNTYRVRWFSLRSLGEMKTGEKNSVFK